MPIEQIRNMLLIAFIAVSFLIWQAWQADYGPKPVPPAETPSATSAEDAPAPPGEASPTVTVTDLPQAPGAPAASAEPAPAAPANGSTDTATGAATIRVTTDMVIAEIATRGGTLNGLLLRKYPVAVDEPDEAFTLMSNTLPDLFTTETGLKGANGSEAPDHGTQYTSDATTYTLGEGEDELEVKLQWTDDKGLSVEKVYVFKRDSYTIDIKFNIRNETQSPWQGSVYGQFQRTEVAQEGGLFRTYTYTGGVYSTDESPYEKYKFEDMYDLDLQLDSRGGWVAMIQHYFAGAFVPSQELTNRMYSRVRKDLATGPRYSIGVITPITTIAPGGEGKLALTLYAGPKIQERLEKVAPNLERTVDYGWLWFIAEPLFWLLNKIHSFLGNWGWSIIVLTLLIKLAFFQLSAASYKSMARMRKMQPRITQIRERYGDDRQRMNQAMMELYKTEKINPLGGCLPIVVQIPVFIALYWVLLESVELRQAPFIFWVKDLAVHDPFFVFPLAMGVTMFIQQKLNPAPPDPMQAKIMMALPIVFTFLFLFFPAGLTVYWFVNNLLSIAQQWVITNKIVGKEKS
ncbi:MAG: membrane protein insertase YidC [Gammaproteobacteria bacterium]